MIRLKVRISARWIRLCQTQTRKKVHSEALHFFSDRIDAFKHALERVGGESEMTRGVTFIT
jgi:beta-glucosidase/6-phospho-beta-glucosidase/beta-galactosidase